MDAEPGEKSGKARTRRAAGLGRIGGVIDAYIAELHGSLRGPRRARSDLVTEARDSLVDAAEAYESRGLVRLDAERRAVREFGDVRLIADAYQTELGIVQTRRTARLVLLVIGSQGLATEIAWRVLGDFGWTWQPAPAYALLARTVDWVGLATVVLSALTLVLCGSRYATRLDQRRVSRVAGVSGLAVCGFFGLSSITLTAFSPLGGLVTATLPGLVALLAWCAAPAMIAASARRCLHAA